MITLTRETLSPSEVVPNRHVWPLRVTATSEEGGPGSKIFVYQSKARGGLGEFVGDVFSVVASTLQMEELPEDAPSAATPFYRTDTCEFIARSESHALDVWNKISTDVRELVDNYKASNTLEVDNVITFS